VMASAMGRRLGVVMVGAYCNAASSFP
jgi:hypothetical protein